MGDSFLGPIRIYRFIMKTEKKCSCCKQIKALRDFHVNNAAKDGLRSICKFCRKELIKDYHGYYIFKKYGINKKQYQELLNNQNGCCAICGKYNSKFSRKLAVDHDHNTGIIRGLLCRHCNQQLGHYEKNKIKFAKYLQNFVIK